MTIVVITFIIFYVNDFLRDRYKFGGTYCLRPVQTKQMVFVKLPGMVIKVNKVSFNKDFTPNFTGG